MGKKFNVFAFDANGAEVEDVGDTSGCVGPDMDKDDVLATMINKLGASPEDASKVVTVMEMVAETKSPRLGEHQFTNGEVVVALTLLAADVTAQFADLITKTEMPADVRAKLVAAGRGRLATETAKNVADIAKFLLG